MPEQNVSVEPVCKLCYTRRLGATEEVMDYIKRNRETSFEKGQQRNTGRLPKL